jgi:SAM-dependent methyltransferase
MECASCSAFYPLEAGILELVAGRSGAPGYDPHYFATLSQVEAKHFWYVYRREVILDVMRRTIPDLESRPLFDLGCGSGGLLTFLSASGVEVGGACDAYLQGLTVARSRLDVPLIWIDEGRLPPLGSGYPLLSLFDVLEHLDDDASVLSWIASVLAPGGVAVLTVPAHPFLFDEMDVLACHRRRYTRADLRKKLRVAGLEVRAITHFMSPLVPALVPLRALGRVMPRSAGERRSLELSVVPFLNALLLSILRLERPLLRLMSLPFGTSLIAVAARPDDRAAVI